MPTLSRTELFSVALSLLMATDAAAQSDLFLRDTASDTGVEPYAGPGPVYLSPDIWVLTEPDSNYEPEPFTTSAPPWSPSPHQNPEYRDTKTSRPNYVYVRIHNRGETASTGTERLRLYQAKAGTGLGWPVSWVDNMDNACGDMLLHGIEVTKPRRNARSVSDTDRLAYRDAVVAIASDPEYRYDDAVQYFAKQNTVHISGPEHRNPAFPPWHREMVNRYENLLREHDPLLTLLYWDFRQPPNDAPSLFTDDFMGPASGTVTGTLGDALPVTIARDVSSGAGGCTFDTDAALLGSADYEAFRQQAEVFPRNHDCAHGYIGGTSGNISFQGSAAQDPFFFLLHANVDRHWANWQRDGAQISRIDPVSAYGSASSNSRINAAMTPWSGTAPTTPPWTGGLAISKTSKDRSITYPPIYDTAPLTIPALGPGQSVVIEIPWYPPDVNGFNCQGDAGHFCLLARIETETTAPFGMAVPEVLNVSTNTVNNNNIAWKNLTIVDDVTDPGLMFLTGTTVHNFLDRDAFFRIALHDRTVERRFLLSRVARIGLTLPDDILDRVMRNRDALQDLETGEIEGMDRKVLLVTGEEPTIRLPMAPGERFTVQFVVLLDDEKPTREVFEEPFLFDLEQSIDLPRDLLPRGARDAFDIGGVRWYLDIGGALRERAIDGGPAVPDLDPDWIARLRDLTPVDLKLSARVDRFEGLGNADERTTGAQHLSPGEPLRIDARNDDAAAPTVRLSLSVDGEERAVRDGAALSESVSFDTPGIHVIETTSLNSEGEVETRRLRVLVSEDIPPVAEITEPESGATFAVGETISVEARITPAFERRTEGVTLLSMRGDSFATLMEPVESTARIDDSDDRLVRLDFTPEVAGRYMVQVSATDDAGNEGLSGQVMLTVSDG